MAITFPTTLDTLTNPAATDQVAVVSHAGQHSDENDAIEALEAKVGANSSAVTTSHDYKLSTVTSTDKAANQDGTQTLTNKTLTAPVVTSMYQDAGKTKLMTLPADGTSELLSENATQSLTNKTITSTTNNVAAKSLHSATTVVDVAAATAPTIGQLLTAVDSTHATWQTPVTASATFFSTTQVFTGTSPATMTDLNLSAVVGATQRMVMLKVFCSGAAKVFVFRPNGDTSDYGAAAAESGVSSATTPSGGYALAIVKTDASGIVEWRTASAEANCTISVEAYW